MGMLGMRAFEFAQLLELPLALDGGFDQTHAQRRVPEANEIKQLRNNFVIIKRNVKGRYPE